MEEKYGAEKLSSWRWNFEPGPPEGESLKTVYERAVPYFEQKILPAVKEGKNVIICAHQSSLRALVKYIEGISDEDIREVRFSTGELIVYNFSEGRLVRENAEMSLETKRNSEFPFLFEFLIFYCHFSFLFHDFHPLLPLLFISFSRFSSLITIIHS